MDAEKRKIIEELLSERFQILISKNLDSTPKCSKRSEEFRKKGNELYAKIGSADLMGNQVFEYYSNSVSHALPNSEELAYAFGNRSALLLYMKKYDDCISDVDRALKISKSDNFKIKLLFRKIECLASLGLPECETVYSEVDHLVTELGDEELIFNKECLQKMLVKAKFLSQNYKKQNSDPVNKVIHKQAEVLSQKEKESPFESILFEENQKYGRHTIANRDFEAGEIIFVAKPYVKLSNFKRSLIYCSHCLRISWSMIPCEYCCSMFCSENCKMEAKKKYHDIECSVVLPYEILASTKENLNYKLIATRALLMGIKEAGSIDKLRKRLQVVDGCNGKLNINI